MAQVPLGGLAMEGDPRLSVSQDPRLSIANYPRRAIKSLHDPDVSIEEYMYYAALNRQEEEIRHGRNTGDFMRRFITSHEIKSERMAVQGVEKPAIAAAEPPAGDKAVEAGEKTPATDSVVPPAYLGVPDEEWAMAARAARTASWGAVFYLITTDILGPFTVPWALAQMGYGPGVALYCIFGILAFYAGMQMWQMFMVLDSDRYPLKTYGDIAFRVYGKVARYSVNILQSVQLFFNVGILILGSGQAIYQMSEGPNGKKPLCFIACNIIFAIAGLLLGQIRTLARFSWIANSAIWMNVFVIIMTMVVAGLTGPNYEVANAQNLTPLVGVNGVTVQPPVTHSAGVPDDIDFQGQVVGLMQAVYSYGGAMLYCEFMHEMKKPWDFFKAQMCAEAFIFSCYLLFGLVVYSFQGQYTVYGGYPGLSSYTWQTVGNALVLISGLIAACLYGNIGIKVVYQNVFRELFSAPELESRRGKMLWVAIVPAYWLLAFVVCSAIPNITNFSGLIAAVCIMQFSYTFPPILKLGLDVQIDAMLPEERFDPATGHVSRVDYGWRRWARGFRHNMPNKIWMILFATGSAATAVLGIYSSAFSIKSAFAANPNITSFGCTAPI